MSVIIPTFNRASSLPASIESVLRQSLRPGQVIVVDDGSTDTTPNVVASYSTDVESIRQANKGKPAALNAALRLVRGDYVWILDDDDVALDDALERFTAPLEAHSEFGFCYSSRLICRSTPTGQLAEPIRETVVPQQHDDTFLCTLLRRNFVPGASLLVRKAVYDRVGGFDERLIRSQDYEMAIRIARFTRGTRAPGGPTYQRRVHSGLRGSEGDRFGSDEIQEKWQYYNRIFLADLYGTIPLDVYNPCAAPNRHDSTGDALLERIGTMAGHGLTECVTKDIEVLLGGDFGKKSLVRRASIVRSLGKELLAAGVSHRQLEGILRDRRYATWIRVMLHALIARDWPARARRRAASIKRSLRGTTG